MRCLATVGSGQSWGGRGSSSGCKLGSATRLLSALHKHLHYTDIITYNQSNSMTSRRYIIYCAKRWPNRAGSVIPRARTFLREPEGSVAMCRCVGDGSVGTCRCRFWKQACVEVWVWRWEWMWEENYAGGGGGGGGGGGSVHFPVRSQLWRRRLRAAVLSCNRAYSMRRRKRQQFSED
jgi:hypothetical protein